MDNIIDLYPFSSQKKKNEATIPIYVILTARRNAQLVIKSLLYLTKFHAMLFFRVRVPRFLDRTNYG